MGVTKVQWDIIKKAPIDIVDRCLNLLAGDPKGTRTPVTGVRGQCPRPLDDGASRRVYT